MALLAPFLSKLKQHILRCHLLTASNSYTYTKRMCWKMVTVGQKSDLDQLDPTDKTFRF